MKFCIILKQILFSEEYLIWSWTRPPAGRRSSADGQLDACTRWSRWSSCCQSTKDPPGTLAPATNWRLPSAASSRPHFATKSKPSGFFLINFGQLLNFDRFLIHLQTNAGCEKNHSFSLSFTLFLCFAGWIKCLLVWVKLRPNEIYLKIRRKTGQIFGEGCVF